MEKKCKKAKWLSEKALQIAVKRKEVKSKGEKGRYKHLNAEFQRIASRDKKDFLSNQCKEIEENNRMGKTRDLFKKIRDTKRTFLFFFFFKDGKLILLQKAQKFISKQVNTRIKLFAMLPGTGSGFQIPRFPMGTPKNISMA